MKARLRLIYCGICQVAASLKTGILKVSRCGCGLLVTAVLTTIPAWSQEMPKDLGNKSIEELMQIEVTSPSKKAESLLEAPSAIFVLTGEDILRGRFSSIPDALRMVPGLHVAQQSSHVWW